MIFFSWLRWWLGPRCRHAHAEITFNNGVCYVDECPDCGRIMIYTKR